MHSEAIGSVWTFSNFFEIFWIFESFFNVSARNFYKRLFSRHNIQDWLAVYSFEDDEKGKICVYGCYPVECYPASETNSTDLIEEAMKNLVGSLGGSFFKKKNVFLKERKKRNVFF